MKKAMKWFLINFLLNIETAEVVSYAKLIMMIYLS